ncbi:aldo-keto reductase 1 [Spatholobus suberectus]|nr:aldo-keto reductase 1 [Spatholobus suberectus]
MNALTRSQARKDKAFNVPLPFSLRNTSKLNRELKMEKLPVHVPRMKLGSHGLEVSRLGFGCVGLSGLYNAPLSHEAGCSIIKEAFNMGVTFFDTSDFYGLNHDNEILIGKALKELPREKVQLATKFGLVRSDGVFAGVKGTPEYVRQCCEASLKRLDVEYIDLYFQHRVDISVPIEDTMGELKKLVNEGKIKYVGLSQASPDTIRRAHAVHPISALQMEYSLWTRDIEEEIIPLCRELGIGIVAYSPLGHGFFAGKAVIETLPSQSTLAEDPRFSGENLEKNKIFYNRLADLASKHSCTPSQLALAWLLHQGNDIVPIPGRTTKIRNLENNVGSLAVKLKNEELREISDAVPVYEVAGKPGLEKAQMQVPRVKLGGQGLEVSRLGFGCGGLSGIYNAPLSHEEGCSIIKEVFNKGVTFFDTSDLYGHNHDNEIMVGKALKQLPREKVQLATKFGVTVSDGMVFGVKGTPEYVRQCCEDSLKRLAVDHIDLYYQHRVDTSVPIEDTMGELKHLVNEGKIKYIGLSEANADTIRRAHAVHPITALQMEYSLWTRDIEEEIIPLCRELGIGIVAYSPLGRGFFAGKAVVETLPSQSLLAMHPRFSGENLEKNKLFYKRLDELASKHECTPSQLALAWLLHQGNDIIPIPGTTKLNNFENNIGSLTVKLTDEDLREISEAVPVNEVAGTREYGMLSNYIWKFATTPPK